MSRRIVLTAKQIYERRGLAWQRHYDNRAIAAQLCKTGWDGVQITRTLSIDYPEPTLEIDGWLLDVPLYLRQEHADRLISLFKLSYLHRDLLCSWYWTEPGWLGFVRQYQALPDVYEAYYYAYDPEPNDRLLLVPMSSKPKQGSGEKVQVGYKPV